MPASLFDEQFERRSTVWTPTTTPLDKQLARIDIGVAGVGEFNSTVSESHYRFRPERRAGGFGPGLEYAGALITVRYIMRPYVALKAITAMRATPRTSVVPVPLLYVTSPYGVQTNVDEEMLGYVS